VRGAAIKTVCLVGIGNMGRAMAARLVKAGYQVMYSTPWQVAQRTSSIKEGHGCDGSIRIRKAGRCCHHHAANERASRYLRRRAALSIQKIILDMSSGAPAGTPKIAAGLAAIGVSVLDGACERRNAKPVISRKVQE
jgi:3-hydroxyisobutyrate dehydrogenase-like beta-hydroxyacid dehydrogenase